MNANKQGYKMRALGKKLCMLSLPWLLVACSSLPNPYSRPASEPATVGSKPTPSPKAADVQKTTKPAVTKPTTNKPVIKMSPPPKAKQPAVTDVDETAEAPAAVTALLERAALQLQQGNDKAAQASLERAIRIAPRYPQSYFQLAELRFQQGNYAQAKALAQKTLSLGPDWWLRRQAQDLVERSSAQ